MKKIIFALPALLICMAVFMAARANRVGYTCSIKPKEISSFVSWNDWKEPVVEWAPIREIRTSVSDLPQLDVILDDYIRALGGREAITKLTTRKITGLYIDDLPSRESPVHNEHPFEAYAEAPDKWMIKLDLPNGSEQNGYDGETGWKVNPDRIEKDSRMQRSWLGFILNPQGSLYMNEYFGDMHVSGMKNDGERTVYVVETNADPLWFDTKSGLLVKAGGSWELQDYRKVDGIMVATRVSASRKGGETFFSFKNIQHNIPIDDGIFSMPDHEKFFPEAFAGIDDQIKIGGKTYAFYPEVLNTRPDIPSPYRTGCCMETVTSITRNGEYTIIPVTLKDGLPYKYGKTYKGYQLQVNGNDFPSLAGTGLHADAELDQTEMITGRSVAEITDAGQPGAASGAGFMSRDEDILSVLKGDNRLVRAMGLTHPQMARALFHLWNTSLKNIELSQQDIKPWGDIQTIFYNRQRVHFTVASTRGWQNSIFDDEIYGGYHINIWREILPEEKEFLHSRYSRLKPDQMETLIKRLSHIHIGEMVPYYIMRYGFYEGHTDYRADPIALAFIFGLKTLKELEAVFDGQLYEILTTPFPGREY